MVELSEYDITYAPMNNLKSQVYVYFLIELSSLNSDEIPKKLVLSRDDSSKLKDSRAWIVLEGLGELILDQSLYFNFQAINNRVEYEAVISGLKLAREVWVSHLLVCTDS